MSRRLDETLDRAVAAPRSLAYEDLEFLLSLANPEERNALRRRAYELKCRYRGKLVSMRGIVEMGNVCAKDCYYCGIRKSNASLTRYQLSVADVGQTAADLVRDVVFFGVMDVDMVGMGPYLAHPDTPLAARALQALAHDGRERGILAGANVMMPNVTDTEYRRRYQLYSGKPCLGENATLCRGCLERRLSAIGEAVNYGQRGDSPHYLKRKETQA